MKPNESSDRHPATASTPHTSQTALVPLALEPGNTALRQKNWISWLTRGSSGLLIAVSLLAGCGGGEDKQPTVTSEVTNEVARDDIAAAKGSFITVPNSAVGLRGATVEIPPDAAKGDIQVQVGFSSVPPGPLRSEALAAEAVPVSQTILLKVANGGPATFNRPAIVTMPYDVAAAGGLPPAVVYWDPTAARYRAVAVVGVDRQAGMVTFRTSHFSAYMAVIVKKLDASAPAVDTGFRLGVNSVLHPNFSYYGNGGVCAAFATMSTTYFGMGKSTPLYAFAQEGATEQPIDDDLTRSAMLLTYASLSTLWQGEVLENRFSLSAPDAGLLILESMIVTGEPVHLTMRGTDVAHSVVAYAYDDANARFRIYDSNFPKDEVTFDWNLISGFGAYSKRSAYPLSMFKTIGYATDSSFGSPATFQKIVADWESGTLASQFANLRIRDDAGADHPLKHDSAVTIKVPYADHQTVFGTFTRPVGSSAPVFLHVYRDGIRQGMKGVPVDATGSFVLTFPAQLESQIEMMLLVSESERDAGHGMTAFGKFTVQSQGANFLANFGFESGDLTSWTGETSSLNNGTVSTPTKLTIVGAGFDPIATDLPTTLFGRYAVRVNDSTPGYHRTFIARRAAVPTSGNPEIKFNWAAVLEDPQHGADDQPYVEVVVRNVTRGVDLYRQRYFTSDPSFTGWKNYAGGQWKAIPWQSVVLPGLSVYAGDEIELRIEGADCGQGAHGGYVYLDGEE